MVCTCSRFAYDLHHVVYLLRQERWNWEGYATCCGSMTCDTGGISAQWGTLRAGQDLAVCQLST